MIEKAIEDSDQIKSEVIATCSAVIKIIDESLVVNSGYVGPEFQHSHGLSVYLPWDRVSRNYKNLNFAKETEWENFLHFYSRLTRCSIRIPESGWPGGIQIAVRLGIAEPIKSGRASEPWKRASEPWKRGQLVFISMKNPPREWLPCDILIGHNPQPKPLLAAKDAGS
jgi:hypothetical protein